MFKNKNKTRRKTNSLGDYKSKCKAKKNRVVVVARQHPEPPSHGAGTG
jgi:hypothetical protein